MRIWIWIRSWGGCWLVWVVRQTYFGSRPRVGFVKYRRIFDVGTTLPWVFVALGFPVTEAKSVLEVTLNPHLTNDIFVEWQIH
jgi:hypothetical protein